MATVKTEFTELIAEDIRKYEGVRIPLKTGFVRRTFIRWTKCTNLHPNPGDEFCFPDIGPNFEIISDYVNKMKFQQSHGESPWHGIDERLMVERMYPEGYMLVNGHHRWAAALRLGIKWAPIQVLNLVHEDDIINIVEKSGNNKRVAIDLDEIVFVKDNICAAEKSLPFPANRRYREKIRRGFPAMCRFFQSRGYDVWVYTADYYSVDYLERLFAKYHTRPDGIITASGRVEKTSEEKKKRVTELMRNKYNRTVNLYNDMMIVVDSRTGETEQIALEGADSEWVVTLENEIKRIEDNDKEKHT